MWEVEMMFSKVDLGTSTRGMICLCLQSQGESWVRGSGGGLCGPRGQSQMTGESYRELIQLSDQEGLGNRQRMQLWGK